jgi:hypothetical protein
MGNAQNLSDIKVEFVAESPFIKITPPAVIENGEELVNSFLKYVEYVTKVTTVELPMLSVEMQSLTPEEIKLIIKDCQEEIQTFTKYRVYEVTKNSMANMDDLAELPIILAKLAADLGKEVIGI